MRRDQRAVAKRQASRAGDRHTTPQGEPRTDRHHRTAHRMPSPPQGQLVRFGPHAHINHSQGAAVLAQNLMALDATAGLPAAYQHAEDEAELPALIFCEFPFNVSHQAALLSIFV